MEKKENMSDIEKVKAYLADYSRFVVGDINEIPEAEEEVTDPGCREMMEVIQKYASEYKSRRNGENIMFGQLGLGLFALLQGDFRPIRPFREDGSMVLETIRYFNGFIRSISKTVGEVKLLSDAVREGDFTLTVSTEGWQGDVKRLIDEINRLTGEVNVMLADSYRNGLELSQAAETLRSATGSLSSATTEQAAALVETAGALEEITGGLEANTEQANAMAALAVESKSAAESGRVMAEQTVNAITEINSVSEEISKTVKVIENIASQTNILSLNAAIEATRAGSAGRGFAVVATEVRKLAARSAEAAKQIRTLTETANAKSSGGLEVSQQMIRGMQALNDKIVGTETIVAGVTVALNEQLLGLSQINDAVRQLDLVTQENSQNAEATDAVANDVGALADRLVADAERKKFIGKAHR